MVEEVIKADLLTLVRQLEKCIAAMESGDIPRIKLVSHQTSELIKKMNLDG